MPSTLDLIRRLLERAQRTESGGLDLAALRGRDLRLFQQAPLGRYLFHGTGAALPSENAELYPEFSLTSNPFSALHHAMKWRNSVLPDLEMPYVPQIHVFSPQGGSLLGPGRGVDLTRRQFENAENWPDSPLARVKNWMDMEAYPENMNIPMRYVKDFRLHDIDNPQWFMLDPRAAGPWFERRARGGSI